MFAQFDWLWQFDHLQVISLLLTFLRRRRRDLLISDRFQIEEISTKYACTRPLYYNNHLAFILWSISADFAISAYEG